MIEPIDPCPAHPEGPNVGAHSAVYSETIIVRTHDTLRDWICEYCGTRGTLVERKKPIGAGRYADLVERFSKLKST